MCGASPSRRRGTPTACSAARSSGASRSRRCWMTRSRCTSSSIDSANGALSAGADKIVVVAGRGSPRSIRLRNGTPTVSQYVYTRAGRRLRDARRARRCRASRLWAVDGAHTSCPRCRRLSPRIWSCCSRDGPASCRQPPVRGARADDQPAGVRKRPARTPKAIVPPADERSRLLGAESADADGEPMRRRCASRSSTAISPSCASRCCSATTDRRSSTGAEASMNELIGGAMARLAAQGPLSGRRGIASGVHQHALGTGRSAAAAADRKRSSSSGWAKRASCSRPIWCAPSSTA